MWANVGPTVSFFAGATQLQGCASAGISKICVKLCHIRPKYFEAGCNTPKHTRTGARATGDFATSASFCARGKQIKTQSACNILRHLTAYDGNHARGCLGISCQGGALASAVRFSPLFPPAMSARGCSSAITPCYSRSWFSPDSGCGRSVMIHKNAQTRSD